MKKTGLWLVCVLLMGILLFASEAGAEPYVRITYPDPNPTIGKAFTAHYEILEGINFDYDQVTVIWPYTEGWATSFPTGGEVTGASGDVTTIPEEGETICCQIDFYQGNNLVHFERGDFCELQPNPDYDIEISFDQDSVLSGEDLTASYAVHGGSGDYKRVQAMWGVYVKGEADSTEDLRFGQYEDIPSEGTLTYTAGTGRGVVLAIRVEDRNGSFAFVESRRIAIEGGETIAPEISIWYDSDTAYIGKPFKAHYRIDMHGQEAQSVSVQWPWKEGWSTHFPGDPTEALEGDVERIQEEGEELALFIRVTDGSGIDYSQWGDRVKLQPNPDFDMTISFSKRTVQKGEPVTASYSVSGGTGIYTYLGYKIGRKTTNDYVVYENQYTELSGPEGEISLDTATGSEIYIALKVADTEGNKGYIISKPVTVVSGETPELPDYSKAKLILSCDQENVTLGSPLTVHYQLSGAEAGFERISIDFHNDGMPNLHQHQSGAYITIPSGGAAEGDVTFIPECGNKLYINAYARLNDIQSIYSNELELEILENQIFSIDIRLEQETPAAGVPIRASYQIVGGTGVYETVETWWDIMSGYEDITKSNQNNQVSTSPTGESTYVPKRLSYDSDTLSIYFSVKVKDSAGNLGWAFGEPVRIQLEQIDPPTIRLKVPEEGITLGKPFEVQYEISGGSASEIDFNVSEAFERYGMSLREGDQHQTIRNPEGNTGSVTFTPQAGRWMLIWAEAKDENGMGFWTDTEVTIRPDPEFQLSAEFDRQAIPVNETLRVTYASSGPAEVEMIKGTWWIMTHYEDEFRQLNANLSEPSGTASLVAKLMKEGISEQQICFYVIAEDGEGRKASALAGPVRVLLEDSYEGMNTIRLPESLTKLEAEALAGTHAEVIIIPEGCTSVDADAFLNCPGLIYIVNRSGAEITAPEGTKVLTE